MIAMLAARRGRLARDWTDWAALAYLLLGVAVMFLPVLWLFMLLAGFTAQSFGQCSNPANPIVAENCLTGNPQSELANLADIHLDASVAQEALIRPRGPRG